MYTYDGCCGSCVHMNTNDYTGHKDHCYCTYRRQYYNLTESKCSYYKYDPNKDYYDLNHRWYIVSVICEVLGLSDDYECVSLLHNFRINVLEKDSRYNDILAEYDIIGPIIANLLKSDCESKALCQRLLQLYLTKVLNLIKNGNNVEALKEYLDMVNLLKDIYDIKDILNDTKEHLVKSL